MPTLNFTVNGNPISVEVQPNEFLAEVLRYDLGLTGTKIGCKEAECGICTVLVDGCRSIRASTRRSRRRARRSRRSKGWRDGELAPAARGVHRSRRGAVRVLHARPDHDVEALLDNKHRSAPTTTSRSRSRIPTAAARATPA